MGVLYNSQTLFAPQQRTITDGNNNVVTESLTFAINGSLRKREVQPIKTELVRGPVIKTEPDEIVFEKTFKEVYVDDHIVITD